MGTLRRSDDTDLTLYVILRNASHQVVIQTTGAGDAEAYDSANWLTYDHEATEQGDAGYYYVTTSNDLSAGIYWIEWKYQSGDNPAVSDTVRASGSAYWDGSAWWSATVDVGSIAATDAATRSAIIDTILADTNELQTAWVNGGRLDLLLDSVTSVGDPWLTTLPGAYGAGTAGEIIGDWKNGERLDLILDARAATGADGDTLETLSDQMDALAATSGSGARTVTLTVNDGSTALESASVRVTKGAATYVQTTDTSGEVTFNLDAGTYVVAVSLVGYTYSGTTIVVDGDETATYSMTAISITGPTAASLCAVQFQVNLSATAVSGAICKARLLGINQASDGTILSNAELSDTTDVGGAARLELVRKGSIVKGSGMYKIWIEINGRPTASIETTIPAQSSIYFEDLIK